MPKHGPMTPKAIANKMKAKGLGKLRFYCQICQKQCRDEHGFKCHMKSESHQCRTLLVGENLGEHILGYSNEFLDDFMTLLKRQYRTRHVRCNAVYDEYIRDRHHIHMNATRWHSLTAFVQWLGREGLCKVEPTDKGWYIKYIDRDPVAIWKKEALEKKRKTYLDDEQRMLRFIELQIKKAESRKKEEDRREEEEVTQRELDKNSENKTVSFNPIRCGGRARLMGGESSSNEQNTSSLRDKEGFARPLPPVAKLQYTPNPLKIAAAAAKVEKKEVQPFSKEDRKRNRSALEEIKMLEEQRKEKINRKDYWLTKGVVVKVVSKRLGVRYFKKKAVIEDVKDYYTAVVRVLDSNTQIKLDQVHLETVIPAIGGDVMVVNGAYRGLKAQLLAINMEKFCVSVEITEGLTQGRVLEGISYEDVSKLHS